MINDFKLLRGGLKETLIHGDHRMTLEVLEDGLLFVEVIYEDGGVTMSSSDSIVLKHDFSFMVEYSKVIFFEYVNTNHHYTRKMFILLSLIRSV